MSVSVAMIVRDEQQTLSRCLDSIAGQVDEIVIVDTGSTDATVELARSYTERVFTFTWCDDFAAARQYAFDQAREEWVCWLDADDVVTGAEHIRRLAAAAPAGVGGFYWRYLYARDHWGHPSCELWRERCVRHNGSFRWAGRVHEALVADRQWEMPRVESIVVEHHPPSERAPFKNRRNRSLLERELAAKRDQASSRLLFYLGQEYAGAGELERGLDMLARCVEASSWDEERYLAQVRIADLSRRLGRHDQAIEADLRALKICPHWPDAYYGLAESYYYQRDWHKVIHLTEVGRAMPEPDSLHIVDPTTYRHRWIIFYTNALYHVGAVSEAWQWTRRALELCPGHEQHLANLEFFAGAAAPAVAGGA